MAGSVYGTYQDRDRLQLRSQLAWLTQPELTYLQASLLQPVPILTGLVGRPGHNTNQMILSDLNCRIAQTNYLINHYDHDTQKTEKCPNVIILAASDNIFVKVIRSVAPEHAS